MLEGKIVNNRQATYLETIQEACMAAKCLSDRLINDFPTRTEAGDYFSNNFDETFELLNGVNCLLACVVGIFDSKEF